MSKNKKHANSGNTNKPTVGGEFAPNVDQIPSAAEAGERAPVDDEQGGNGQPAVGGESSRAAGEAGADSGDQAKAPESKPEQSAELEEATGPGPDVEPKKLTQAERESMQWLDEHVKREGIYGKNYVCASKDGRRQIFTAKTWASMGPGHWGYTAEPIIFPEHNAQ